MGRKPEYINFEELKKRLGIHLVKCRKYSEEDVLIALYDFKDPYTYELCECTYCDEEYINDERYEVRAFKIDFTRHFGSYEQMYYYPGISKDEIKILRNMDKPFCFYAYFKVGKGSHSTSDYIKSERLYKTTNLAKWKFK